MSATNASCHKKECVCACVRTCECVKFTRRVEHCILSHTLVTADSSVNDDGVLKNVFLG